MLTTRLRAMRLPRRRRPTATANCPRKYGRTCPPQNRLAVRARGVLPTAAVGAADTVSDATAAEAMPRAHGNGHVASGRVPAQRVVARPTGHPAGPRFPEGRRPVPVPLHVARHRLPGRTARRTGGTRR